jgi:amino acid adenylation domain-containing protein
MAQDSESSLLVTMSKLALAVAGVSCPVLVLDLVRTSISEHPCSRPVLDDSDDASCYIIYTSGTTGKPKGVAISQASICNFISVVVPLYGLIHCDRVYQGITLAFDFSIEEIWPTFAVGATLVAGPTDHRKLGSELAKVLHETKTTVLHCVPTLLSTIDRPLPHLKIINVGGEACPSDLVNRWSTPGRKLLNTYGPTETTVTASLAFLTAGKDVTIGKPLPTYTMYILDENQQPVREGALGEIWIGGKAVANGYLNRPDKTAAAFYPDFLVPPEDGKEVGRLFRTGDIGRLTWQGEIDIKGRIDDQVKIRGYRIELSEIEAVIQGEFLFKWPMAMKSKSSMI